MLAPRLYRWQVSARVGPDAAAAVSDPAPPLTFLMTDVEGSTRLWEQQREEMAAALAIHDGILKDAIASHGGELIKTTGDGVLAKFSSATAAVTAAADIQRRLAAEQWPTSEPILVRVAVHTGLAQAREGDFFGPALN